MRMTISKKIFLGFGATFLVLLVLAGFKLFQIIHLGKIQSNTLQLAANSGEYNRTARLGEDMYRVVADL